MSYNHKCMIKLLLFIFLLFSCSKFHEVERKNGIYFIKGVYSEIDSAKNIEWKVGRQRESIVSKGIRFSFTIPKVDSSGRTILKKKHGIDSWVFRVSRQRRSHDSSIGYFYYPFSGMTESTRNYTVNLYYHAASVSKRFRMFHCPAFDHRYNIEEMNIVDRPLSDAADIFARDYSKIPAKVSRIHINPMIFSGGRSLEGKYFVDFALYNSETKQRFSEWKKVDKTIVVSRETSKSVASCTGVREEINPLPESRMPDIRDLEIK